MAITSRLIYLCSIIHWTSLLGFKGAIKIQFLNGESTKQNTPTQHGIKTYSRTLHFSGFGRVHLGCFGEGDSSTWVYANRTDKYGNRVVVNPFISHRSNSEWLSEFRDKPDKKNFPYIYQCVMESKCCATLTSSPLKITYYPTPNICPAFVYKFYYGPFSNATKRSVKFSWEYDPDPEDKSFGLFVKLENNEKYQLKNAILNLTTREYVLHGLDPDTEYSVNFAIYYSKDCHAMYGNRFITLPDYPSKPRNVTIIPDGNALIVSWLPPKFPNGDMKYYILLWRKNVENREFTMETVGSSPFSLENLEEHTSYEIKIQAFNEVGAGNSSIPVIVKTQRTPSSNKPLSSGAVIGIVIGAILFVILLLIIIFLVRRKILKERHAKSVLEFEKRNLDRGFNNLSSTAVEEDGEVPEATDPPEEISYITLLEDWEINSDHLKVLNKKLGEGQFGSVKQALFTTGKGDPEIVAVKTLKANAKKSDIQDLMAELMMLKDVNKIPHPNIIRFIGGCSLAGKLHVVTEFCPGGALRDLLLKSRVRLSENLPKYVNLASTLHQNDLLKFAADISNGMAHLSSQKLVHRDLAARNILLAENYTAKVSDFGLARDVGGAEEYIRNNQNLLPVKWMALESLLQGRFTTASDVWSFGVLLYEITTLGEVPYKNISAYHIVNHVGSGCRMSKPPSCSDEIYEIMSRCWKEEPTERPSFVDLHESLLDMLKDSEKPYINITHVSAEG